MDIQDYLKKMKHIQQIILDFLDDDKSSKEYFQDLINFFQKLKTKEDKYQLKSILHMILQISNEHHRLPSFFLKIEQILNFFKDEIILFYSNFDIFNIFKDNKRILLYLFEGKIIQPSKCFYDIIRNDKYVQKFYPQYFYPEFSNFYDEKVTKETEEMGITKDFIENDFNSYENYRKNGENNSYICELIRNDAINEFITIFNQKNLSPLTLIEPSIYETNLFLMKNQPNIIEYSAFFGSTKIFKYLQTKKVKLNQSLWLYAIHSQNPEVIHLLEESSKKKQEKPYRKFLFECIKCHHNAIMKYIRNNLLKKSIRNENDVFIHSIKSYNFKSFPKKIGNEFSVFYNLCKYDYYPLVELFLNTTNINVNQIEILNIFFLMKF